MMERRTVGCTVLILFIINVLNFIYHFGGYKGLGLHLQGRHYSINEKPALKTDKSPIDSGANELYNIQHQRKKKLQSACQTATTHDNKLRRIDFQKHLFVVDNLKAVFCLVPKAGSTNWKKTLLKLINRYESLKKFKLVHQNPYLRTLKSYSDSDTKNILANYTKILIVRNPFSRILSAYKDKIQREAKHFEFRERLIPKIIKMYRKSPTRGNETKMAVTFQEFVRYLIDPSVTFKYPPEEHWREMYRLCAPCQLDYDIIGKIETIAEDSTLIFKTIGSNITYPAPEYSTNASVETERYYSTLSNTELKALRSVYKFDFKVFDYKPELPL